MIVFFKKHPLKTRHHNWFKEIIGNQKDSNQLLNIFNLGFVEFYDDSIEIIRSSMLKCKKYLCSNFQMATGTRGNR